MTKPISTGSRTTRTVANGSTPGPATCSPRRRQAVLEHHAQSGSYTSANPSSAGTHDAGGAVDISVASLSATQRWQTVQALRTVGFAAWLRNPSQGDWPYHIHAVAISDTDLATGAANQVHDYYFGKNGLANHAADDTPSAYRVAFTWWEKYPAVAIRQQRPTPRARHGRRVRQL